MSVLPLMEIGIRASINSVQSFPDSSCQESEQESTANNYLIAFIVNGWKKEQNIKRKLKEKTLYTSVVDRCHRITSQGIRGNYNSLPSDICRAKRTNVRSKLSVV